MAWINKCMKLFGIANNVRNFLEKSMEQWKLSLTSNGEDLMILSSNGEERDILRRQPFTNVVCFEHGPLSLIFRKVLAIYE